MNESVQTTGTFRLAEKFKSEEFTVSILDQSHKWGVKRMKVFTALVLIPMLTSGSDLAPYSLDWIVGCWVSADKSSQEVWVVEGNNSLIGFGVSLGVGELAFYEVLSIKQNDDGLWTYTAHPSGQASASFIAAEIRENSVVFKNPSHDYPQKISYRRDGSLLYATVSLIDGDKPSSFDKIACD
jgi:hypothetical protein